MADGRDALGEAYGKGLELPLFLHLQVFTDPKACFVGFLYDSRYQKQTQRRKEFCWKEWIWRNEGRINGYREDANNVVIRVAE